MCRYCPQGPCLTVGHVASVQDVNLVASTSTLCPFTYCPRGQPLTVGLPGVQDGNLVASTSTLCMSAQIRFLLISQWHVDVCMCLPCQQRACLTVGLPGVHLCRTSTWWPPPRQARTMSWPSSCGMSAKLCAGPAMCERSAHLLELNMIFVPSGGTASQPVSYVGACGCGMSAVRVWVGRCAGGWVASHVVWLLGLCRSSAGWPCTRPLIQRVNNYYPGHMALNIPECAVSGCQSDAVCGRQSGCKSDALWVGQGQSH